MHSGGVQLFGQRSQPAQSVFFWSRLTAWLYVRQSTLLTHTDFLGEVGAAGDATKRERGREVSYDVVGLGVAAAPGL